jgi:hypothetical protein
LSVSRGDWQIFFQCNGDDHPIKRLAMVQGQFEHTMRVTVGERENGHCQISRRFAYISTRYFQLFGAVFDRNFRDADGAHTAFDSGILEHLTKLSREAI